MATVGTPSLVGNGTLSNPNNIVDGDQSTAGIATVSGNGAGNSVQFTIAGPAAIFPRRAFAITLKIAYSTFSSIAGGGGTQSSISAVANYQGAFAGTLFSFTNTPSKPYTIASFTLSPNTNLSQFAVIITESLTTAATSGSLRLNIYDVWFEVQE
jgi:hypothetical protein